MTKSKKSSVKSLNNAYRAGVLSVNKQRKKDKKLSNRLNYMKRHLATWLKNSEGVAMDGLYDTKAQDAKAFRTQFLFWMFIDEFRYDLMEKMLPERPDGENRSPKTILKLLKQGENFNTLKLSDYEKVQLANLTGSPEYTEEFKGGISIFRILQIAYGVHKYVIDDLGNDYTKRQLTESKVLEAVEKYKERQAKETLKRREDSETETENSDVIVEDHATEFVESDATVADILEALEAGEIKSTDLMIPAKIRATREIANGATKGALTRQLNRLVET